MRNTFWRIVDWLAGLIGAASVLALGYGLLVLGHGLGLK